MTQIHETTYKGYPGICMENGALRAIFLPLQGSKLCSLVDLVSGQEYIYQGKTLHYRPCTYADGYLDGECAGVDECFPNIDECYYHAFPWNGTLLPDHGEVWALPWDATQEDESLTLSVNGVRLPYNIRKRISLCGRTLRMDYTLTNLSGFDMDFIWAAHMMLQAQEGCTFQFPTNLSKAYVTMSDSGTVGRYGDTFHYPGTNEYDFRVYRGDSVNDYQKIYFADKLSPDSGWAQIHYPDGSVFEIRFPTEEVPYLGAIQAEGGELDLRCMFLEPCSAAFDRPDIAKLHRMNSILGPRETRSWYLEIEIQGR